MTQVRSFRYLQLLVLVWLAWEYGAGRILQLLRAFVLGTYLTAACVIANYFRGIYPADRFGDEIVGRYTAFGRDPNYLAFILLASIPIAGYLNAGNSSSRWRWLWTIHFPLVGFAIILTGSRSALMASVLPLIVLVANYSSLSSSRRKGAWLLLGVQLVILVVLFSLVTDKGVTNRWKKLEGTFTYR